MNEPPVEEELARQRAMVDEHHHLIASLRRRLLLERLVFIAITAVLLVVIWRIAGPQKPAVIQVQGKRVVTVASKGVAEQVIAAVKNDLAGKAAPFADFKQKVRVVSVPRRGAGRITPADEAQLQLGKRVEVIAHGYGIYVSGRLAVALPTKEQAERVLPTVQVKFSRRGNQQLTVRFREPVEQKPVTVKPDRLILKTDDAVAELTERRGEPETYVVKAGDTGWEIADSHGLSLGDLQRQNPGRNLNRIHIGDELSLGPAKPTLTVVATEERRIVKPVPFPIRVIPTSDIPGGQRKVIQQGKEGQEVSMVRNTYHNGLLVEKELLSKEYDPAPVPQKVLVGR